MVGHNNIKTKSLTYLSLYRQLHEMKHEVTAGHCLPDASLLVNGLAVKTENTHTRLYLFYI